MLTRHPVPEAESVTDAPRPAQAPSTRVWLQQSIHVWVAIAVGLSWFVFIPLIAALEPTTDQSEPLIGTVLGVSREVLFVAMLVGLAVRRRWGLVASLAAAGLL